MWHERFPEPIENDMTEVSGLRTTPIELLFADEGVDLDRLGSIRAEAEEAGQDPWNPMAVSALPSVAAWLSEIRPGGEDPHAVHAYSALVFYAMHALSSEGGLWVLPDAVARSLATPELEALQWSATPPTAAGYLQLPHNLFWVQTGTDDETLAEAVDGIFWASGPGDDGLWVMLAAGVREGRPGFSAVVMDRVPFADVALWSDQRMRAEGEDFENVLPGGDLAGFLSVATSGEALKLLARAWRQVELHGSELITLPPLSYRSINPSSEAVNAPRE